MKTPRACIVIAVMGSLERTKPFWGALLNSVAGPIDLMIIDNAPEIKNEPAIRPFLNRFITPHWPGEVHYSPQDNNLGVVKSLQFGYENTEHEHLFYLHNDVYIYEWGWDLRCLEIFDTKPNVGLVGFFGGEGIDSSSGRNQVHNNMLEAEIHGYRNKGIVQVAVLDGLSMFASRKMLDIRDGVDTSFTIHHFYDLDLSLESIDRGFNNYVIGIPIHHHSGQTACLPLFNNWANKNMPIPEDGSVTGEQMMYELNLNRWKSKWSAYCPWRVGQPWK